MRTYVLAAVVASVAIAWVGLADTARIASPDANGADGATRASIGTMPAARGTRGIASNPDRGRLFDVDEARRPVANGASKWQPVEVSEAHALQAIASGGMTIDVPGGRPIQVQYQRHVEHEDGNWTWIGRAEGGAPGTETILTFGEKAVFGVIHDGTRKLDLLTEQGGAWLVQTAAGKSATGTVERADDFLVPGAPPMAALGSDALPLAAQPPRKAAMVEQVGGMPVASALPAWTDATVDIVLGYTAGFAARLGGQSQAVTRLHFLVDVANQAFLASNVSGQVRAVRTLQVDYPDNTSNYSALVALTGVQCATQPTGNRYQPDRRMACSTVPRPASLEPLTSARETYGADLVVLVRKFEDPENGGCGKAWLLGGNQTSIAGTDGFAMSVVSDSSGNQFPDNNNVCREDTLAHEVGHNLGQQHDLVTAGGDDDSDGDGNLVDAEEFGRHPYSFSHSVDGTQDDFYTVMSVRRPGQAGYRIFANPDIVGCAGQACGTADRANNARSLREVMPSVAAFRSTVAEFWDVTGDFWAFDSVRKLADAAITGGCGVEPPLYCPLAQVTRDQMAVFLLRAMHGSGYQPPDVASSRFADVASNFWAADWIEQLAAEGITSGCASNPLRYCPGAPVNREQMAIFLLRAKYGANYVPPPATGEFVDVPASHPSAPWIEKLAEDGITTGCTTTPKAYCPANPVTRDQMAVFLVRSFGL